MLYTIYAILYIVGTFAGLALVFRKAGIAFWKGLVPIYNIVLWIKMCEKSWKWYVYFLIPAINIFVFLLMVVETAKCFRRYGFWEQTFAVIFPWIYMPYLGLSEKRQFACPKDLPPHKITEARDWLDAIVFALVAAVIIRGNVVEFYNIPSSSMEKSLLTGDYLMVSKLAYGPRTAMTPLSMPLVHNVMPLSKGQTESYLKWIKMPYHRYPGLRNVERFDAVVFNYPDGDTMCTAFQSNASYHDLARIYGRDNVLNNTVKDPYTGMPVDMGKIRVRPVDKRENFIKRCIGLPGDDLQIVDQQVLINGKPVESPNHMQVTYRVMFNAGVNPVMTLDELGVSQEDIASWMQYGELPLTQEMAQQLSLAYGVAEVSKVMYPAGDTTMMLFPHAPGYNWSVDNFGPIHIPAKGEVLHLTAENLPLYRRLIAVFEENTLEERDGRIFINGQETDQYVVKMNYYWMMGDNRHNSADSRYWGFVPENHIVGRAAMVVFSKDKDHHKVRWNRIFKNGCSRD